MDVVRAGFGVADSVSHMGLHAGHVVSKTMERILHDGFQVFGHPLAAINMGIGVQQNLHALGSSSIGQIQCSALWAGYQVDKRDSLWAMNWI
jgi:hypothetical protein